MGSRRKRRSTRLSFRFPMRTRFWATIGAVALAGLVGVYLLTRPAPAAKGQEASRVEIANALKLYNAGAITESRNHARVAVQADPNNAVAHAVLARIYLQLDDGVAAESELDRANKTGATADSLHHMYAEAWLLQGDAERALAEVDKTPQRYSAYAWRVKARALAVEGDYDTAEDVLQQVVAQRPQDSEAWTDLARVRQAKVDVGGAIEASQKAVVAAPNNPEALTVRAEMVRTQFGLVGSLPWFEAALKHDPYDHEALVEYAATLGEVGRYSDMLSATRRALFAKPGSPQALYLQASLAARAGDVELSRSILDKGGADVGAMPAAQMLAGALDYAAGDWQQAVGHFGTLVGQQNMNIPARRMLASSLLQSGDAKGALEILRPVATRGDADAYTLDLVGRAFEATGQREWAAKFLDRARWPGRAPTPLGSDAALEALGTAAMRAPNRPEPQIDYIRGLIDAGNAGAALTKAQALAAQNPGTPAAQVLIGDILMTGNHYADAATAYRKAADLQFDEPTMLRLVEALDRAGQREQASNTLAVFLSQNPINVAAQRLTAHWQIASGQWDDAIDTLERLHARLGDRDAALLTELAYAYLGSDDVQTATTYAAAAYKLTPSSQAAADAFGWALFRGGDATRSMQLLEKAVQLDRGQPMVRFHLAQVYAQRGRKADAVANVQAALAMPGFSSADDAQAFLAGLA